MNKIKEKDIIGLLQDIADKINSNILDKEPSRCGDISFCDKNSANFIIIDGFSYDNGANYYAIICSLPGHCPVHFHVINDTVNEYSTSAKSKTELKNVLAQTLQNIIF